MRVLRASQVPLCSPEHPLRHGVPSMAFSSLTLMEILQLTDGQPSSGELAEGRSPLRADTEAARTGLGRLLLPAPRFSSRGKRGIWGSHGLWAGL